MYSFCHSVPCSMPSEDLQADKMNICIMNICLFIAMTNITCHVKGIMFVLLSCQCLHER